VAVTQHETTPLLYSNYATYNLHIGEDVRQDKTRHLYAKTTDEEDKNGGVK